MGQHCGIVKLLPMTSAWSLVHVLATSLLIQHLVSGLDKSAEDGPRVWAPATYLGDSEKAPGSGFCVAIVPTRE